MMKKRPPIVAVMGHVDHGKTTLLDYLRKTNVASREAGGITQSIGAYEITHHGERLTFIDTPGHEAFSKMRKYGAQIADLAILVVAADDGVKPQTKDALAHINRDKLPFVVAVNKIDKPTAQVDRVKNELAQAGVYLEGYGGNVSWHAISAKTGEGVEALLDLLVLASDLEHLTYDPDAIPSGAVISVKRDGKRGIAAGIIIENGILKRGEDIATPSAEGKIKILENFLGEPAAQLSPSAPALVIGFDTLPRVGEPFFAGTSARAKAAEEKKKELSVVLETKSEPTSTPEHALPVILNADEAASLEVLTDVVHALSAEFPFTIISTSLGNIHESEVKSAETSGAVIAGFRVRADKAAENLARAKKITILTSGVIYELETLLKTHHKKAVLKEKRAIEVLAVFGAAKGKERIVGGHVLLGPVKNQEPFEIWREKRLVGHGKILNLQSKKQNVAEAVTGMEVGLLIESEEPVGVGNTLVFD